MGVIYLFVVYVFILGSENNFHTKQKSDYFFFVDEKSNFTSNYIKICWMKAVGYNYLFDASFRSIYLFSIKFDDLKISEKKKHSTPHLLKVKWTFFKVSLILHVIVFTTVHTIADGVSTLTGLYQ